MPSSEAKALQQSNQPNPLRILAVGLSVSVDDLLGKSTGYVVVQAACDLEKLMEPTYDPPDVILCGFPPAEISPNEVAQSIRMLYPSAPIFCVCTSRAGYERKVLVKNGFTDAFLLPLDSISLKTVIMELIAKFSNGTLKSYRSVKLVDIHPGTILDFDTTIYLPSNNKYIRYSSAGDPLDEERVKKLSQHKLRSLYVPAEQIQKFYDYTAKCLKDIGSSETLSSTEKKERLESSVRELITGIFNDASKDGSFEQGKSLVKDCQEIIKTYVLSGSEKNDGSDWYSRLLNTIGDAGSCYASAANVSTYASLFSIGLQIGKPADLAMAGLLQDIGLADVPAEIVQKSEAERTPEEQALYNKHPEHSVKIIKERRLVVSEIVIKAISQHHESYNGGGYPLGLIGSRICEEAQILALADRFNQVISTTQGQKAMSPRDAVKHFKLLLASDPSKIFCNPELLNRVLKLFPEE